MSLTGVCDSNPDRAHGFGTKNAIGHVFTSVDELIRSETCDVAHVLVPPPAHLSVAQRLVDAGVEVLLEKPMGCSSAECRLLRERADASGIAIGVNHNAIFYPAHVSLRQRIKAREFGRLQHLVILVNVPSNSMPPPGHWSLHSPENLVFEFGVHPLSQILDLAGHSLHADTMVSGEHGCPGGPHYFDTWQASMLCERATAQLFLSYGGTYRTWRELAVCQDGVLIADVETNSVSAMGRTAWGPYFDLPQRALGSARQDVRQAVASFGREALAAVQPTRRRDPYFISMRDSISAFYAGMPAASGSAGADVVTMCEEVTQSVKSPPPDPSRLQPKRTVSHIDVVVLGGTGFIGRSLVAEMVRRSMTVRVMGRNPTLAGEVAANGQVQSCIGDITDGAALQRAIAGAAFVVHLAHGGRFEWDALDATMIRPAHQIVQACLEQGVRRLVYTGTIASLYLGNPSSIITGSTPIDPRLDERGPYEWGKARGEEIVRRGFQENSLPACIFRPGIVLGAGGTPFHGGFGVWRGEIHCIGWNLGRNPLPLVLAKDVATAILAAMEAPSAVGKTYNLVGDVRMPARDCISELRTALERPIVFHPRLPSQRQSVQLSKWVVKRVVGASVRAPSYRGIKSMGCNATFDCSDVKLDLNWKPQQDRSEFIRQGLHVHADDR